MLFSKMEQLVQRRKNNIWDKQFEEITINDINDYKFKNVFELRDLCKKRGITQTHKTKDEMIRDLEQLTGKKYIKNE